MPRKPDIPEIAEIGGLWVGSIMPSRYFWPLARLEAGPDFLRLSVGVLCFRRSWIVPKEAVYSVSKYESITTLTHGIQFRHYAPGIPELVVFWTRNPEPITVALLNLGYPIKDSFP
jgi:hypothetical protein